MIILPPIHYRLSTKAQIVLGVFFLLLAAQLLLQHALRISAMRDSGLPSAMQLPTIERRMNVLKEQADAMELQASLVSGANDESLRAYVLPSDDKTDRLLAALDVLTRTLEKEHAMRAVSAIHVGDSIAGTPAHTAIPVSLEADVTQDGLSALSSFIAYSGLITVNDVLSDSDRHLLLSLTEQENPAAVTSLEHFLGADLHSYARNPKAFEDQLMQSFSSDAFGMSLHQVILSSKLPDVVRFLTSDAGKALTSQQLLPNRFLQITHEGIRVVGEGWYHVSVGLEAEGHS